MSFMPKSILSEPLNTLEDLRIFDDTLKDNNEKMILLVSLNRFILKKKNMILNFRYSVFWSGQYMQGLKFVVSRRSRESTAHANEFCVHNRAGVSISCEGWGV